MNSKQREGAIRNRIANLEQTRRLNRAWQEAGMPAPDDDAGWRKVADLYGCSDNDLRRLRAELKNRPSGPPFSANEIETLEVQIRTERSASQAFAQGEGVLEGSC